ncbi:NLR family CARD domain-containing protein 3-like isoform X2 [Ambystoma mexicanum]|uniref:NLR family CARD domain-containing protein 3-like isoform X2 n=1 Tax=Ambystoma mexicanum TaxID=8296 RepID=UPI0037E806B9
MAAESDVWWSVVVYIISLMVPDIKEEAYTNQKWYLFVIVCFLHAAFLLVCIWKRRKTSTAAVIDWLKREVCKSMKTCCSKASCGKISDECVVRELLVLDMAQLCEDTINGTQEACVDTITTREMFTREKGALTSERMLMLGEAGIGKRCFCEELVRDWGSGQRMSIYDCIIYLTLKELNSIKHPVSLSNLLKSKYHKLPSVLGDLLHSYKVLLILDGLDDLRCDMEDSEECPEKVTIETSMRIGTLLSGIITKKLLPETHVLVTSRLHSWRKWKESFGFTFVMLEFAEEQVSGYCEAFSKLHFTSKLSFQLIVDYKLFSLVSFPLLNRALCEIGREQNLKCCVNKVECYKDKLDTWSRMLAFLLQLTLRNISPEVEVSVEESQAPMLAGNKKLQVNVERSLKELARKSYENLISNLQEIKRKDLENESDLLQHLCEFFLMEKSAGSILEYRHDSIRSIFAALHCVEQIKNAEELGECLNTWAFGEVTSTAAKNALLQNISTSKQEHLQNFIRYIFGFIAYEEIDDLLLSDPRPIPVYRREVLNQWLKQWIRKEANLLNIFHCIFELHDDDVTKTVSSYFSSVSMFNTQLYSLDLTAMQYSLSQAHPETLDIRQCGLNDGRLKLLPIIEKCTRVWLSSNKLTEKSVEDLADILRAKTCAIENLSLDNNKLGPIGAQKLWKAIEENKSLKVLSLNRTGISAEGTEGMARGLEKNTTLEELLIGGNKLGPAGAQTMWQSLEKNKGLKVLYLNDNEITAKGTEGMAEHLQKNSSLEELFLCGNPLGEVGVQNMKQLDSPKLKVLFQIADDENLLHYIRKKCGTFKAQSWQTDDPDRTMHLLQTVLEDLRHGTNKDSEMVTDLKQDIENARNIILQKKKMQ